MQPGGYVELILRVLNLIDIAWLTGVQRDSMSLIGIQSLPSHEIKIFLSTGSLDIQKPVTGFRELQFFFY